MGYYTRHELSIINGRDQSVDYENELTELTQYGRLFDDEIKWYNHEKDMIEFSKKHPNTLFMLYGEGEENIDIWKEYYKNGKTIRHIAEVVFPEFNENQLG